MAYRDDRQAIELQVAELQLENEKLRKKLLDSEVRAKEDRAKGRDEQQRAAAMKGCPACGGSMLPAAVFAGTNNFNPIPMRFSTLRFSSPTGGFTDSAPVRAKVCASCGFVFHYIDMPAVDAEQSGRRFVVNEHLELEAQRERHPPPADEEGDESSSESSAPGEQARKTPS